MDLVWLEDFLKLADEGNFSRAAKARNLSQPAFSRRIKAVEEWVGATLIDRETHRVVLTESGAAFRTVAQDVLTRIALGRDEAREAGARQNGMIRFAATQTLSVNFFPTWLRGYEAQDELGTVSLVTNSMGACEQLMLAGHADFLLCHDHPAAKNRLNTDLFRSVTLGVDRLVPVCRADGGRPRFALPGDPASPVPYLAFDEPSGMGRILDASGLAMRGHASLRTVFRSHLASALLHMACGGMGVAWAPFSLCEAYFQAGNLVCAGDSAWEIPIEIRLFRPRARRNIMAEDFWKRITAKPSRIQAIP